MRRWLAMSLSTALLACGGGAAVDDEVDAGVTPGADADLPLSVRWIAIPGGSFDMGCAAADSSCPSYEAPSHRVTVDGFEMAETETTQAQYAAQIDDQHENRFADCADCPADTVGWAEATAFCAAIGGRLPTEAEWEYAARGGSDTVYGCGDDPACLADHAWYFDNAGDATHPVRGKSSNPLGLYDMLGNVWEWVEDCWHDDYATAAPTDGSAWLDEDCSYRVLRGGSWGLLAGGLRVSNRGGDYPDGYTIPAPGFRCVR